MSKGIYPPPVQRISFMSLLEFNMRNFLLASWSSLEMYSIQAKPRIFSATFSVSTMRLQTESVAYVKVDVHYGSVPGYLREPTPP